MFGGWKKSVGHCKKKILLLSTKILRSGDATIERAVCVHPKKCSYPSPSAFSKSAKPCPSASILPGSLHLEHRVWKQRAHKLFVLVLAKDLHIQHQINLWFIASLKIRILHAFVLCFCCVLTSLNFSRTKSIPASMSRISELSTSMKGEADDGNDEQIAEKIGDAESFWCSLILSFAWWQATELIQCCWGSSAFFFRTSSFSLIAPVFRRLRICFETTSSREIFAEFSWELAKLAFFFKKYSVAVRTLMWIRDCPP